jgi:hypothetical protein
MCVSAGWEAISLSRSQPAAQVLVAVADGFASLMVVTVWHVLCNLQAVDKLWSGWHVAFYISRFSSSFSKVSQLGINQLDHPYRDKSPGLAEALANRQFRFKDVVRLDSFGKRGATLFKLGHEVRSMHHPGFLRPLYNRTERAP